MSEAIACGFVLEVSGDSVKFYDWNTGNVVSLASGLTQFPVLGECYQISQEGVFRPLPKNKLPPCFFSIYVNHGDSTVIIETPAVTTKTSTVFPAGYKKEIMENYKGAVWSPVLRFIDDPDFFVHNIPDKQPFVVSVAYNTKRDEFEILDKPQLIANENMENFERLSPWNQEIQWHEKEAEYRPKSGSPRFTNGQLKAHEYYGICIFANVANPYFRGNGNRDGVPAKVSFLYNNRLGLIRAMETDLVEGKRYEFKFMCGKYKNRKEERTEEDRKRVFEASKAIELREVPPTLPTDLTDPFQITVSFPFSEIKWQQGPDRVKYSFYGEEVGKVFVGPDKRKEIFERIENYRASSKLFAKGIVEGFIIEVSIEKCPYALLQRQQRDRNCFLVKAVHSITKHDGQEI